MKKKCLIYLTVYCALLTWLASSFIEADRALSSNPDILELYVIEDEGAPQLLQASAASEPQKLAQAETTKSF